MRDSYELLNDVERAYYLRITNLETEESIERDFSAASQREYTSEEQAIRRIAYALATIDDTLNISLQIPTRFTGEAIDRAEWVAKALTEGAIRVDSTEVVPEGAVLICGDSAFVVRQLLNDFERDGMIGIHLPSSTEDMSVELLGYMLKLGPAHWAFGNTKIINVDELQTILADPKINDDTVRTVFEIDKDEVYLEFANWPQKDKDTL